MTLSDILVAIQDRRAELPKRWRERLTLEDWMGHIADAADWHEDEHADAHDLLKYIATLAVCALESLSCARCGQERMTDGGSRSTRRVGYGPPVCSECLDWIRAGRAEPLPPVEVAR